MLSPHIQVDHHLGSTFRWIRAIQGNDKFNFRDSEAFQ